MVEEFYGFYQNETTIHFCRRGKVMVAFAIGNAGFLEMGESTRDPRGTKANVWRFAPCGSRKDLR